MNIFLSILLLGFGSGESAFAFSPDFHLGVESHFSRNVVTPSTFPFFRLGMESKDTHHELDLELKMSFEHPRVNTASSKNFYYQLNEDQTSLRFAIGRKWVNWSDLDETFGLGAFNVLDSWDRLRSSSQGLTGIFMSVENESLHFDFFASYLMLPELTPNVVIENHRFEFLHPQSVSAGPQTFDLLNRPTPLGYNLTLPSLNKILLRPSIAFGMDTKKTFDPFFAKFSFGYLPLNYFPIALQASLAIPIDQIVVDLRPRLLSHILYNTEVNYRFAETVMGGFSVLVDHIFSEEALPSDYTTATLGTTTYLSPWVKWNHFKLSHIYSDGGIGADTGPYANPAHNLFSSRVLYRNATQLQFNFRAENEEWTAKALHEFSIRADWLSLDWKHHFSNSFSTVIGGDLVGAEKDAADVGGAEFLSDLRALDRIRVGVNYVF